MYKLILNTIYYLFFQYMDKLDITEVVQFEGLNPLIAKRWSPRTFENKEIEPEKIKILFEAARWAPSSYKKSNRGIL